jgi:uncharacterized protein (DUF433 family)
MDWQEHITLDPNILVGKPVIKGTRLAVEFIIDLLAQGWSEAEILRNYPGITSEQIQACLNFVDELMPNKQRVFGQYAGKIWMSEDFDEPLPDSFWLGES